MALSCYIQFRVTYIFNVHSRVDSSLNESTFFKKQSLIVVVKMQIWDGLTRCDQPLPATLRGPRAGSHGTVVAPCGPASAVRASRPRGLSPRLSVVLRRSHPLLSLLAFLYPLPRLPQTHQRFRFVVLTRLTDANNGRTRVV